MMKNVYSPFTVIYCFHNSIEKVKREEVNNLPSPLPPRRVVEGYSSISKSKKKKQSPFGDCFFRLVAGVGFEPHDLRVMSPTSYQAALPRDIQLRKVVPETGLEPVRDFHRTGF